MGIIWNRQWKNAFELMRLVQYLISFLVKISKFLEHISRFKKWICKRTLRRHIVPCNNRNTCHEMRYQIIKTVEASFIFYHQDSLLHNKWVHLELIFWVTKLGSQYYPSNATITMFYFPPINCGTKQFQAYSIKNDFRFFVSHNKTSKAKRHYCPGICGFPISM